MDKNIKWGIIGIVFILLGVGLLYYKNTENKIINQISINLSFTSLELKPFDISTRESINDFNYKVNNGNGYFIGRSPNKTEFSIPYNKTLIITIFNATNKGNNYSKIVIEYNSANESNKILNIGLNRNNGLKHHLNLYAYDEDTEIKVNFSFELYDDNSLVAYNYSDLKSYNIDIPTGNQYYLFTIKNNYYTKRGIFPDLLTSKPLNLTDGTSLIKMGNITFIQEGRIKKGISYINITSISKNWFFEPIACVQMSNTANIEILNAQETSLKPDFIKNTKSKCYIIPYHLHNNNFTMNLRSENNDEINVGYLLSMFDRTWFKKDNKWVYNIQNSKGNDIGNKIYGRLIE